MLYLPCHCGWSVSRDFEHGLSLEGTWLGRTVVVNHELNVAHDLSVTAMRLLSHLANVGALAKDTRGL